MAKTSGLGWTTLTVGDAATNAPEDIRNDITNLQFATPRGVQDTTGIDKSAHERLLLLADFSITLNGVFNPAVSPSSHDVFKTVPSTSAARSVLMTVGGVSLNNATGVLFTDYTLTRSAAGELTWSAPGALSSGNVPTWT